MKKDRLLEIFFQPERWEKALNKGIIKDIDKGVLSIMTRPETRLALYRSIRDGEYQIIPPHTALIPKDDPGEFRTVYINEAQDRIILSILNDMLFELCPEMVHKNCRSYLTGVGCGKVVKNIAARLEASQGETLGFKADLSKYFDSVPINYIDDAFKQVEVKFGHSALIDVLRKYYHSNVYIDVDGEVKNKYQSLKQGCAVASWLADVVLRSLDEKMSLCGGLYVRYSDDIVYFGDNYQEAMNILAQHLGEMSMKLNPKKVEYISKNRWFKFLGFSIHGGDISMSKKRLKNFQKEIQKRTVNQPKTTPKAALNAVNAYLYKGFDGHSWATAVLPVINVEHDIKLMNEFIIDCLRAVTTGKKKVGGLGYHCEGSFCVARGTGRNVTTNRKKVPMIEGYYSLKCMQNTLKTSHAVFDAMVRLM
ncbi:MAG: hypothetical protein IKO36_09285 [Bacteroidaceae bacterium]|nr:hypothetical protein [Bacteroidaceae bacterium]